MIENPANDIKKVKTNYQTAIFNLHHCLDKLFFRYFPLSADEFTESNNRRASYDYIIDIIEHIKYILLSLFQIMDLHPIDTYNERYKLAEKSGIFPKELADALCDLTRLRTKIIHKNEKADLSSEVYCQIDSIIVAGFAAFEIAKAIQNWSAYPQSGFLDINKSYLENIAKGYYRFGTEGETELKRMILSKLANESVMISIEINFAYIGDLIQENPGFLNFPPREHYRFLG
jgi:uncharacterized protein YutE (UPF0331/DUF86 family)